jgi:hypothetical protein
MAFSLPQIEAAFGGSSRRSANVDPPDRIRHCSRCIWPQHRFNSGERHDLCWDLRVPA